MQLRILGTLLKQGIKLRASIEQLKSDAGELQAKELRKLLEKASDTMVGKHYGYEQMLNKSNDAMMAEFRAAVPLFTYNKIYEQWWHRAVAGEKDVAWPGKIKYFALSSGTSEAASKQIPVTTDMIRAIKKAGIRQILALANYDVPPEMYEKGMLMLGGSTHLNYNGTYFSGDLSGITTSQIPFWFQHFYKPGKKIAQTRDWNEKLDEITRKAKDWDIGYVLGVPAWIQILMEKIVAYYGVKNIHEIWPNLSGYCHGGVSFEPYKKSFESLLGKPILYFETYLASEGFIAFQARPGASMRMMLNNGIFYEFIPFNEANFTPEGELVEQPQTLTIAEVEEGKEYALLLSTCAGAWRYLIGDVIKIVNKAESEITITGRTKHFLSLCGEHLSVDNMNKAVKLVSDELNINIKEFTVAGVPHGTLFAHRWYLGVDTLVAPEVIGNLLDSKLKELNDDYKVEREAALKEVSVKVLPIQIFYDFMEKKGKSGGQNKFPRVIKKAMLQEWEDFIRQKGY